METKLAVALLILAALFLAFVPNGLGLIGGGIIALAALDLLCKSWLKF